MFGAQCPQLLKMLTTELRRVQNDEEHEYVKYRSILTFIKKSKMINSGSIQIKISLYRFENNSLSRAYRFCIDVSERSPEEIQQLKIIEETRIAKEAAKRARKGFPTMNHYKQIVELQSVRYK